MNTKRKGTGGTERGQEQAKLVVTSIRLDSATHSRLKDYAHFERRSVSGQLRKLIDDAVAAHEQEQAA